MKDKKKIRKDTDYTAGTLTIGLRGCIDVKKRMIAGDDLAEIHNDCVDLNKKIKVGIVALKNGDLSTDFKKQYILANELLLGWIFLYGALLTIIPPEVFYVPKLKKLNEYISRYAGLTKSEPDINLLTDVLYLNVELEI